MSIIDYSKKAEILNNNKELIANIRVARIKDFRESKDTNKTLIESGVISCWQFSYVRNLERKCKQEGQQEIYNECIKIVNADYNRASRLNKRVAKIVSEGDSVFLTLTFSDETMSKYDTPQKRRKIVQRYLTDLGACYVANVDYGKQTEREHYHALIGLKKVNMDNWLKYGFAYAEQVRKPNEKALSKYISKLTNHAIKETTKRCVLMYSR